MSSLVLAETQEVETKITKLKNEITKLKKEVDSSFFPFNYFKKQKLEEKMNEFQKLIDKEEKEELVDLKKQLETLNKLYNFLEKKDQNEKAAEVQKKIDALKEKISKFKNINKSSKVDKDK